MTMQQSSPLRSDHGDTTVADVVVSKIAALAAQDVDGVTLGGGSGRAGGGFLDGMAGGAQPRGVAVEVGQIEAAIDLTMAVAYGRPIPTLADEVRRNVVGRVQDLLGLRVTEVNISVTDIILPPSDTRAPAQQATDQGQPHVQ